MTIFDKILITGGGGMLAHALADELTRRGISPTVLSRSQCDIADRAAVDRLFESPPTLFLNCAAHTKVDQCEAEPELADAINGHAVGQIAALCRKHNTCLVHVSTDFVFDGELKRPYRPDDATHAIQAYGQSKLLGEIELRKNAPRDWLLVRTAWVYGRHGVNFPRTMVNAARAGKPLSVVADQVGSPTYTADLAGGILALLDAGARGIYHITNSDQTTWLEFARSTLEEFGLKTDIAPLTSAQWKAMKPNSAVRPYYTVLDIEKFAQTVGRPMRPWREALKDFRKAVERDGF
ncbi:MAG TPA: dTDP-4-dehydrorhamnose reductase [Tepidisphaeraceae bacterium]|nr:dTDP-4-dehydrorhamnose reductase [Tepidisphaeraceae bacterium]